MEKTELELLVIKAQSGDGVATEKLLLEIKDQVYRLSLRMLFLPHDAEDATQEILIKVYRHLNEFKKESAFTTWVYSIARNHLIDACNKQKNRPMLSFDIMMMDSNRHVAFNRNLEEKPIDDALLTAELKVSCTRAMLQCLDEEKRMMFILSEIMGINSNDCALIFETSPTTYRKRLSRINEKMRAFMSEICGLVNDNASCHCGERVEYALSQGRINRDRIEFVKAVESKERLHEIVKKLNRFEEISAIYHHNPSETIKKDIINKVLMSHF